MVCEINVTLCYIESRYMDKSHLKLVIGKKEEGNTRQMRKDKIQNSLLISKK